MTQQRERKQKPTTKEDADKLAERDAALQQDTAHGRREAKQKERQDQLDELDELLDEIDGLLEEQEVLANFKQRGGQ